MIFCAIAPDFDIFFFRYAPEGNHRNFFTHSMYPPLILFAFGLLFWVPWMILGSIAYFSHLFIDLSDWGTNLFFNNKLKGIAILLRGHEQEIHENAQKPPALRKGYFYHAYYHSIIFLITEVIGFLGMILILWFVLFNYWYIIFGYLFFLAYHMLEYYEYSLAVKGKSLGIRLLDH